MSGPLVLDAPSLLPPLAGDDVPAAIDALIPSPDALADAWAALEPPAGVDAVLRGLGAPALDLRVTPASLRAGLLAARQGRRFVGHELRLRLPMPPGLEPEVAVWQGDTLPRWGDGVLTEPKYFSFFQDGPAPAYHPNHRRKWRSHELLHGVVGFYWHPAMTRFQLYLGARLGELLPVVHWYGLDELYRPRCPEHTSSAGLPPLGTVPPREHCVACEALDRPFDQVDRTALRHRAVAWAARAREHLGADWAACLAELETGRVHATPRPGIDGSSDAQGYVQGHWNRLTAWSFGAWVERFCVPGVDCCDDLTAMAGRVAAVTRELCDGPIAVDPHQQERLATRALLQDAAMRVLLALEDAPDGGRAEQALMPLLDGLAGTCADLLAGEQPDATGALGALLDAVDACAADLPPGFAARIPALGDRFLLRERMVDAGLDQLVEGLESALPRACGGEGESPPLDDLEDLAWHFAASDGFDGPGSLASRFARWMREEERVDADAVVLEALVTDLPRRDDEAELFATLPSDEAPGGLPRGGVLRTNRTLRRAWVDPAVLGLDEVARPDANGRVEVAVAWMDGEAELAVLDADLADTLDAVARDGALPDDADEAIVLGLLQSGLLVWWPVPERG
ncbi:MAG: hypothetical protein H6742_15880 [Alphaproteobacteria bacterium]|nr:hypothetical protein [Alphaproteobacteria bacterium]